MIRILHIVSSMNCGGTENMIMNLYRKIDRNKVQFDFLLDTRKEGFFDKEINELGGKIFYISRWKGLNIASYICELSTFFKAHPEYNVIHGHTSSSSSLYVYIAKKHGLTTIVHSHDTKGCAATLSDLLYRVVTFPVRFLSDYFFACSEDAGVVRFGKRIVSSDRFTIIKNAIELDRYLNTAIPAIALKSDFIIGHIGRFCSVKNHIFLLDVFKELLLIKEDSVLLLLGDGNLKPAIEKKAQELGIIDKVIFAGVVSNVANYLRAMDCFIFPSFQEGLGIAVIEAECLGIPCFINETLPKELFINNNVFGLSLDSSAKEWADFIIKNYSNKIPGDTAKNNIKRAGYDINTVAKQLESFYINICK